MKPYFKGYMKLHLHDENLDNLIDRSEFHNDWKTKTRRIFKRGRKFKVLFYFYDTDGDKHWHEVIEVTDKSCPQTLAAIIYSEGKRIGANTMQHFKKRGEQLAVDFTKSYAVVRA